VTESVAGPRYDAALRLLDRQIIDRDGQLVAKVDDIELAEREDGRLEVTALLTGPGALGPRLGGRLGRWTVAVWRRLHPDVRPQPGRIPFGDVTGIDSAVHVGRRRADLDVDGLERWLDAQVISQLPGANHDPE
jgi:sporulation protein YlmC with PRC-barrel domain